ncbi:DUF3159 domain-containing protein [Gordonia phthalatica]|uniref:DUF3159 domain-containing protein n=1 Tax=Gordonia phthalatica TaxID=1136941 RepID=A0A0N9NHH5_9ACTN|nr:DUF3159 domain-containing protein [Gordonia phthalatica]ALG84902.1 hypothetical protein ACH46_10850 [Gordonia phthalatica]
MWEQIGGLPGLVQSAVPSIVFVLTHQVFGVLTAVLAVLGAAVSIVAVRAARGQSLRPAIGGVVGVAVSSTLTLWTGDARDYFLPDIWGYLICAVVLLISVVARQPLAGVLWSAANRQSMAWRNNREALRAYTIATLVTAASFGVRSGTQIWFYELDAVGAMAAARLVVNYPLWGLTAAVWVWSIRVARRVR